MLELPAGVRKRRNATVKIPRNPLLRFLPLIQKIYIFFFIKTIPFRELKTSICLSSWEKNNRFNLDNDCFSGWRNGGFRVICRSVGISFARVFSRINGVYKVILLARLLYNSKSLACPSATFAERLKTSVFVLLE